MNKVSSWLGQMKETTVSVHLPRFQMEDGFSLKEKLQVLGLSDLFSPDKASLPGEGAGPQDGSGSYRLDERQPPVCVCVPGILEGEGEGVHISDAYHKAFLEVSPTDDISSSSAVIG